MSSIRRVVAGMAICGLFLGAGSAGALPKKGEKVNDFRAEAIKGREVVEVSLHEELAKRPNDLAILFFFSPETSSAFAERLHQLYEDRQKASDDLRIIAIGMKSDEAALRRFATQHGIEYYLVPDSEVNADRKYGPFASLPVTFIVLSDATLLKAIGGGGKAEADVIAYVAETYLMKNRPEAAEEVARMADTPKAKELQAFAKLGMEGKIDDAAEEFSRIDSKAGLAAVAVRKGEFDKAIALADESPDDPYAQKVKGDALLRLGKADEAAQAFARAAEQPLDDWQKNEAIRGQGRAQQEQGNVDGAIRTYRQALELNPWDVTALSNESTAHQVKGDLQQAEAALKRAQAIAPNDAMVAMVLRQVQQQIENANNIKRRELIRQQIADLQRRFQEQKAAGAEKPIDEWTSRPLVVAFLPTEHGDVFFERAGTDVAIQREIEARLQADGRVQVVERELLDTLLQELNLGSSDVANPDTQLRLGKVLSAQLLGFADFAQTGADKTMYLRLVDTETTSINSQIAQPFSESGDIASFVDGVVSELTGKILDGRELRGLIADVPSPEEVYINLGQGHGLKPGQRFTVLQDGGTVEVGGRTRKRPDVPVATLEVTEIDEDLTLCKVVSKKDGVELVKEMKVKAAKENASPQT